MKIGTLALYVFAGAAISIGFCACSTIGGGSQLGPPATSESLTEDARIHQNAIPAGSIFVGFPTFKGSFINIYSGASGGWKVIGKITKEVTTPVAMRVHRGGYLFVADDLRNAVNIYSLPKDGDFVGRLTQDIKSPFGLALDAQSDLAVLNRPSSGPHVTVFPFGINKPYVIKGLDNPTAAIFDGFRDLFVADDVSNKVVEYAPGSDEVISTITDGIDRPMALAIDYTGTLWVANRLGKTVTGYGAAGLIKTIKIGKFYPITLLTHGVHLYIAATIIRPRSYEILDYNLRDDSSVEIKDGLQNPSELAYCDPDICVRNGRDVTIYDHSDALVHTIKDGSNYPSSVIAAP